MKGVSERDWLTLTSALTYTLGLWNLTITERKQKQNESKMCKNVFCKVAEFSWNTITLFYSGLDHS